MPSSPSPRPNEREARVNVEYGQIKAPYAGVITQRNVSPGDYLQPGGGTNGRPLFVLEQTDPVRVFVGVPELASFFVHDERHGADPLPGDPGRHPRGQGRPLGLLAQPDRPAPSRPRSTSPTPTATSTPAGTSPSPSRSTASRSGPSPPTPSSSRASRTTSSSSQIDGKPVRVAVIVGPSDDTYTEILRKYVPGDPKNPPYANTVDWPTLDGTENILVGNLDILNAEFNESKKDQPKP